MCAIHTGHNTHTIALQFIALNSELLSIWPSHKNITACFNSLYVTRYVKTRPMSQVMKIEFIS